MGAELRRAIVTDITSGKGMTTPPPHERHVRVLLSPLIQDGIEDFAVGFTEVPPFIAGTRHHHKNGSEIWLLYSGNGLARVGEEEFQVSAGSVVYTPAGTEHQFVNNTSEPVRLYFLYVPSGEEKAVIDGEFR